MVLFLLGSVSFLILNALGASDRLRESVTIHVMLDDGLTEKQTAALRDTLLAKEVVREATYIDKEKAAEDFIAETGNDFRGFIDFNPLPNSFEVGLGARSSDREPVRQFETEVSAMPGVSEVVYQKNVIEEIGSNLNKFNLILLLFGAALLIISLILLNNTIHITIMAKRRVINTMKLVGATKGFIMRTFIGSAAFYGACAGFVASILFGVMIVGLQEGLPELSLLTGNVLILCIVAGMIVGGVVISLLFTIFAVDKSVKQTTEKAYM
jgi:cell division transport system permease protein